LLERAERSPPRPALRLAAIWRAARSKRRSGLARLSAANFELGTAPANGEFMNTTLVSSLVVSVACSLVARPLLAQDADGDARVRDRSLPDVPADSPSGVFGLEGQLAISSDAGLSISNTSISGQDGSATALVLRPAVDYFVIENFSIGGFLGVDYTSSPGGSSTVFAVGPRVGYNVPLSRSFSIWPKIGFSFASTSQKQDDVTVDGVTIEGDDESSTSLALNAFVPVMFHPVEHFFLGFGPALDTDLTGDVKATTLAGRLTLGGWM
jgi:hypothetical protein